MLRSRLKRGRKTAETQVHALGGLVLLLRVATSLHHSYPVLGHGAR
jgi:hypothetical protein